ncbi:GbsR/MarR family transcriptional regulator [Nonomuraea rubra]|uniref:GbsR/MarR family transcriptional regulator n=1 Tax=Nonomuraea rubra TaxID=46180 RepID=UPI0031E71880
MPGGRLTHEHRRQIASWLADGLGYAEIARRLGRPTSTISREVARNSASGAYLADRAQQAAGQRARRRRPVRAAQPQDGGRPAESVRAFVERFATLLVGVGLPRMPARVFVCLLTSEPGSLTSAELVRGLQVSPASVSKAIGYLEEMELVRRTQESGRRERYVVDDDVWLRAFRSDTGAHDEVAAGRAARDRDLRRRHARRRPAGPDGRLLHLDQRADERQRPHRRRRPRRADRGGRAGARRPAAHRGRARHGAGLARPASGRRPGHDRPPYEPRRSPHGGADRAGSVRRRPEGGPPERGPARRADAGRGAAAHPGGMER